MNLTPAQFSARMAKAAAALPKRLAAAEAVTLKEAKAKAISLSSGTLTPANLSKAGHPYAKRAPDGAYDPGIVNRGKGVFVGSWRIQAVLVTAGGITSSLINIDPNAAFLKSGPNSKMVVHTPNQKIMDAVQPARLVRTAQAVQDAFYRP